MMGAAGSVGAASGVVVRAADGVMMGAANGVGAASGVVVLLLLLLSYVLRPLAPLQQASN